MFKENLVVKVHKYVSNLILVIIIIIIYYYQAQIVWQPKKEDRKQYQSFTLLQKRGASAEWDAENISRGYPTEC